MVPVYPLWHFDEKALVWYLPALAVVALLAASWHLRARPAWRAVFAAFGYFVLLLLPVLGFFNITLMRLTFVADQWQYFAILGPICLVAAALTKAMQRGGALQIFLQTALVGSLLAGLDFLTWKQCFAYANPIMLWETTLKTVPDSFVAHSSLGAILSRSGDSEAAIVEFEKALDRTRFYGGALRLGQHLHANGSSCRRD